MVRRYWSRFQSSYDFGFVKISFWVEVICLAITMVVLVPAGWINLILNNQLIMALGGGFLFLALFATGLEGKVLWGLDSLYIKVSAELITLTLVIELFILVNHTFFLAKIPLLVPLDLGPFFLLFAFAGFVTFWLSFGLSLRIENRKYGI